MDFQEGDAVWIHLSPIDTRWKKGVMIRQVVGVPDSFVVDVHGQQYRRNKGDITSGNPNPNDTDGVVGDNMMRNQMEMQPELLGLD